jgi:hypothetical protein
MATEKQIEASRRNGMKSRGPRTQEGKERSRRNALKHGLTAETLLVLHDEDADLLAERVDAWTRDLGARDEVEECMIRRAATLSWKLDRGDLHEVAVLNRKIRERAEVEEAAHRARAMELVDRLLPQVEDFQEKGFDPDPAAEFIQMIESTADGCRRLLVWWDMLRQSIQGRRPWTYTGEMAIVRLLGRGPSRVNDPAILDLVVAGRVLMRPDVVLDADRWEPGHFRLSYDREALRAACLRQSKDPVDAGRILLAAVDKAVARLEVIRDLRERDGDDWGAEESARVASFDASDEGERLRRYQTTNHREMIRTVESVMKVRLQKVKLEKEEAAIPRNEPNSSKVRQECRTHEVEPDVRQECRTHNNKEAEPTAVLRNEPNSSDVRPETRTYNKEEESGAILRNEPNFALDGVEWVEIPGFDEVLETYSPLRAAS